MKQDIIILLLFLRIKPFDNFQWCVVGKQHIWWEEHMHTSKQELVEVKVHPRLIHVRYIVNKVKNRVPVNSLHGHSQRVFKQGLELLQQQTETTSFVNVQILNLGSVQPVE